MERFEKQKGRGQTGLVDFLSVRLWHFPSNDTDGHPVIILDRCKGYAPILGSRARQSDCLNSIQSCVGTILQPHAVPSPNVALL